MKTVGIGLRIASRLIDWACEREPDFIIGGSARPYLLRWWVIPRNPVFNVYLHLFLRSDDDWALHTHPWLFNMSFLLRGCYREWLTEEAWAMRNFGDRKFRWGRAAHRIELTNGPCWTLFITGPRVRQWGFLCPAGFVHWKNFAAPGDKGAVGRGCDQ